MTLGDFLAGDFKASRSTVSASPVSSAWTPREIEFAGQVRDRDAQEFLLTKGSDRIQAGLEIRRRVHAPGQFLGQVFAAVGERERGRIAPACRAFRDAG